MQQPPGFIFLGKSRHDFCLRKPIHGLKQAPRDWYQTLCKFLYNYGFFNSKFDSSLFTLQNNGTILYVVVYVNDIIVTRNSNAKVNECINKLANTLSIKDMCNIVTFLVLSSSPYSYDYSSPNTTISQIFTREQK